MLVPVSGLALLASLAVHLSTENEACKMWSSAGTPVERGSSFLVFCTSQRDKVVCDSTYEDREKTVPRKATRLNSSTVYIEVVNITADTVYSCKCTSNKPWEPCGVDVITGYPPDRPRDVSCIHHVTVGQQGNVVCRWNSGAVTYLTSTTTWVTSLSGNHTAVPEKTGSSWFSASWSEASPVQQISVKVFAHNQLGSAQSDTHNFTLRDIVKPSPPILILVECSSRSCNITCRSLQTHTEVQYIPELKTHTEVQNIPELKTHPHKAPEQECIPYTGADWQTSSSAFPSVQPLEPSQQYCFRVRAKQSHGHWSDWSAAVCNRTQEEAPDQQLDAWFIRSKSQLNTLTVYWKELGVCEARGRLLGYRVHVKDGPSGNSYAHPAGPAETSLTVQSCGTCRVTVSAYNSRGSSPPRLLPTYVLQTARPPQDLNVSESKDNVSLYWRETDPTLPSTGYLVEWYLQGQQIKTLKWMWLSSAKSNATITEIQQYECYDGAVYVFYEGAVGKSSFTAVNTLVSVPTGAPSVTQQVSDGGTVTVTWSQLPREQRRGCVRNYSIYIENNKDTKDKHIYHVPPSESRYTVERLPPATYSVCMTAWTKQGQGPAGSSVKFIIQEKSYTILLVFLAIGGMLLVVLMLMGYKRLKRIHRFLPDVPDPNHSNWAKAFTDNKGKMSHDIYPADSSSEEEEEEIVKVLEHPKGNDQDFILHAEGTNDVSSLHRPEHDSGMTPQTPYIKSLSQDTHSSQVTSSSAGYIWQAEESGGEGGEEEEEEECTDFSPCNIFGGPQQVFGGMLTLDAVKIDCGNLWENGL